MEKDKYTYVGVMNKSSISSNLVVVTFPDFPGLSVPYVYKTVEDLCDELRSVLGKHMLEMELNKKDIPEPKQLSDVSAATSLRTVLVTVDMNVIREEHAKSDMLLEVPLPAWLIEKANKMNVDYSSILKNYLTKNMRLSLASDDDDDLSYWVRG